MKHNYEDGFIEQDIISMFSLLAIRVLLIDFIELILNFFALIAHYLLISPSIGSHCYFIRFDLQIRALRYCFWDSPS